MAKIDEKLLPLIIELNKMGLKTTQSCEGHKNRGGGLACISIDLDSIEDVAIREKGKRLVIWWKSDLK